MTKQPLLKITSMLERHSVTLGTLAWLLAVAIVLPNPFDTNWALAILAFGPLVIVPLTMKLIPQAENQDWRSRCWNAAQAAQLPAAFLLAIALTMTKGGLATLFVLPWFVIALMISSVGLGNLARNGIRSARNLGASAGMIFLTIGAGWAVLDRWGMRPLDFKPVIVLLTAIHFHYAGWALPILAGLAAHEEKQAQFRWIVIAVVLSAPAVAVGITSTQLGCNPLLETFAAWLMSVAGLLVAWSYWRLARQKRWPVVTRWLWRFASIALTAGMVLAFLYGSRHWVEMGWLDIPWMRALHGTANSLGFSLLALLGWKLALHSGTSKITTDATLSVSSKQG